MPSKYMDKAEILIKEASLNDLDRISYLYTNYMFDSYLLRFGPLFVKRYLEIIISSKDCITLIARRDTVIGFIMATYDTKKLIFKLFFDIRILRICLKQAILHPVLMLKSIELIFYPFRVCLKDTSAELLFIAIEPAYQKMNLAINLITKTIKLMDQKGVEKVKVTTVARNEAVNSLLKKLGFKVEKTFKLFRKTMYLYSFIIH